MPRISSSRLDMEEGRIDRAIFKDYGETLEGGMDGFETETGLTFDGTDDIGTVTANASLNSDNVTISVWVKPNLLRVQGIITKNTTSSWRLFMSNDAGRIEFDALADTHNLNIDSVDNLPIAQWSHIVVTYDKSITTAIIYKNGVAIKSSTSFTNAGNDFSSNIVFGSQETNRFSGDMDDIRIYTRALSSEEVKRLYNKENVSGSLAGYWRFSEATGTTVLDSSGRGNTCALTGTPAWIRYADIQLEKGNAHQVILTANTTFTFSNPTPVGSAQTFTLLLKQDVVGGRTVTWPSSVQWVGGIVPTLTSQKNRYDIFTFTTTTAGSVWLGSVASQNFEEKAQLWAWGQGLLRGNNTTTAVSSPVQSGSLVNWNTISASEHALSIKNDGTLWTWGAGANGRLGRNAVTNTSSPAQVGTFTDWIDVAAGFAHSFGLRASGAGATLWSWGLASSGRGGRNNVTDVSSPTIIGALTNWAKLARGGVGYRHTHAIKTDGTLWGWGLNTYGQLGNNSTAGNSSPVAIGALTNWSMVAGGDIGSMAIKTDGTLWGWGGVAFGSTGLNSNVNRSSPTQVGTASNWSWVSMRVDYVAAIKTDGTLWTWGYNINGELGLNDLVHRSSPTQVGTATNWAKVSVSQRNAMAIKTDGTLWTWGRNAYGQIGDNTVIARSSPTQIGVRTDWAKVFSGTNAVLALKFP